MSNEKTFWNKEYKKAGHLALSMYPSGDLITFANWYEKEFGEGILQQTTVLDIGCGNGRNALYLEDTFGSKGYAFDISGEAISTIKKTFPKSKIDFMIHDIHEPLPLADGSVNLILDLMVSHCLTDEERPKYLTELVRVLEPRGVVVWKSFFKEGDYHTTQLLKKHGVKGEKNSYIHPKFHIHEHVWMEKEFKDFVAPYFDVEVFKRSHGHKRGENNREGKRRYFIAYLVKK